MTKILLFVLLSIPSVTLATLGVQQLPPTVVEDFEGVTPGEFPSRFTTFPFQRRKAKKVYRVADDGKNRFLQAVDRDGLSVQVFRRFEWKLAQRQVLQWRWRPQILPVGARESDRRTNDSACGVYVVFGSYRGPVLKYVWSTTLPIDTVVTKEEGEIYIVVKGNGPTNKWDWVTVNVQADYRRLFGEEPTKEPIGLGLLTDGNATESSSACDYDDFSTLAIERPQS
jgi:hypothetical protein